MMGKALILLLYCVSLVWVVSGDVTVTIYPEVLAKNGRAHFDADRWDGHNGLDNPVLIEKNKAIGTSSGRWIASDASSFDQVTEDPHRKGYPDPAHFKTQQYEEFVGRKYLDNLKGYGNDLDIIMELRGENWPNWMNKSLHKGQFPNNLDAAGDMVLYLAQAVNRYTNGRLPPLFEVINEPGGKWKFLDWDTVVEYHKIVAGKLKKHFPKLKVGGPTNTGHIQGANEDNFKLWDKQRQFLDMSLDNMDFYSFHAYNKISSEVGHKWGFINEARLVAVVDLVESYAIHKKGGPVPIVISEYGLSSDGLSSPFGEWAYGFAHNSLMFSFLNLRGFIDRAVAFLLDSAPQHPSASIYYHNHTYTGVAKVFQFWQNFNNNHRFLRVDDTFDVDEKLLVAHALADASTKTLYVLLQNYHQNSTVVRLSFPNHWTTFNIHDVTCFSLNAHNTPILTHLKGVSSHDGSLAVPSESSCYLTLKTRHDLSALPTVDETTHYAQEIVIPITHIPLSVNVNVPNKGAIKFANLRFAVSNVDKLAKTKPTSVRINGHSLAANYVLYEPGKDTEKTVWDVYVYQVPVHQIKATANSVQLQFAREGGFVSSVALVVGTLTGSPSIIG